MNTIMKEITEKKISVIIPVYNCEKYIMKCLNSIRSQTYTNLEIIVIDDGSTDKSAFLCDEMAKKDNRIKVIHNQNNGISVTRNIGINEASGKYVSFVDSDDYIDDNYFEDLIKMEKSNCLICSNYVIETFVNNKKIKLDKKEYSNNEYIDLIINGKIMGTCWGKLFLRENISSVEFDTQTNYMEDTLFLIQYLTDSKIDKIVYSNTYYHYNCQNENSLTKNKKVNIINRLDTIFYTLDKISNLTNKKNERIINTKKIKITKRNLEYVSNQIELENILNNIKLPKNINARHILFCYLYNRKKYRLLYMSALQKKKIKQELKKIIRSTKNRFNYYRKIILKE